MNNIPTIEELHRIGCNAANWPPDGNSNPEEFSFAAAIRDAVVAACRPQLRPIADMPDTIPDGCVRLFGFYDKYWAISQCKVKGDTHYLDIYLPASAYPVNFEAAFAESKLDAKDKEAAFKLWKKGGER